jgi:hypothetical protein
MTTTLKQLQNNLSRTIWVTFERHGIHYYPTAPVEVIYLRSPHRHLFKFKASISVTHDDRDIEFHMFQNFLVSQYDDGLLDLDSKSCEMLAANLIYTITTKYPGRKVSVEVSEDGECGAILEYTP